MAIIIYALLWDNLVNFIIGNLLLLKTSQLQVLAVSFQKFCMKETAVGEECYAL